MENAVRNPAPLHVYLKETKKIFKENFHRRKKQKKNLKEDLANEALLGYLNPNLTLALFCVASDFAIASVLQQFETGCWKLVAFFSKN